MLYKSFCLLYSLIFVTFLTLCLLIINYCNKIECNPILTSVINQIQVLSLTFSLLIVSWIVSKKAFSFISHSYINASKGAVLITGCDTGFGFQLALKLDQLGFNVFAGVLFPDGEGAKQLIANCSNRLKIRKMDVTKVNECEEVVNSISESGTKLWALVNNAGVVVTAPLEWGDDVKQLDDIFSINVFGAVRVSKMCIPLFRNCGQGRIINICSTAGEGIEKICILLHFLNTFSQLEKICISFYTFVQYSIV